MEVILDHGNSFHESDNVVVPGNKVKALVVHLAPIDGQPSHHVTGVSLLHAYVDHLVPPGHIRVPELNNVGGVDGDVRVNVSCVDPFR